MARTARKKISIKDEGVVLVDDADSIDFEGAGVSGAAVGNDVTETITAGGGVGTVYTEVLTDSGDNKNFTALHTITTIFSVINATSGKALPASNYSVSGTSLILSSADSDLAADGIQLIYA